MRKMTRAIVGLAMASQLVLSAATVAFAQSNLDCIGEVSNMTVFNVLVEPGQTCTLTNVTTLGNVEVKNSIIDPVTNEIIHTTLNVSGGTIAGSVIIEADSNATLSGAVVEGEVLARGANSVSLTNVTSSGGILAEDTASLTVSGGSTDKVEVVKGGAASITGLGVVGGMKFEEMSGEVSVSGSSLGGNLEAYKNIGGLTFNGNSSTGNMQCKENLPAPTGSGNSATSMEDQCALLF